jgi:hypothetical protein
MQKDLLHPGRWIRFRNALVDAFALAIDREVVDVSLARVDRMDIVTKQVSATMPQRVVRVDADNANFTTPEAIEQLRVAMDFMAQALVRFELHECPDTRTTFVVVVL